MNKQELLFKEYDQLCLQYEKHASFPYQAIPVGVTIAGALLAFGGESVFVGPVVTGGLLFLFLAWAIAHSHMVHIGCRIIDAERKINVFLHEQKDTKEEKFEVWECYICHRPNEFDFYARAIAALAGILFFVSLYFTGFDIVAMFTNVKGISCPIGNCDWFRVPLAIAVVLTFLVIAGFTTKKVLGLEAQRIDKCKEEK